MLLYNLKIHFTMILCSWRENRQYITLRFQIKTKTAPQCLKGENMIMPLISQFSTSHRLYFLPTVTSIRTLYLPRFAASNSIWKGSLLPSLIYGIDIANKENSHEKVIAYSECLYFGKWYLGSPPKLTVVIKMNGDEGKEHQVGNAI